MFRSFIIGLAALGLAVAGAPDRAKADNSDLAAGAIFGALLGGLLVATIDDNDNDDRYRGGSYRGGHSHGYYKAYDPPRRYYDYGPRRDVHVYHHRPGRYDGRRYERLRSDREWRHERRHDRREARRDRREDRREARRYDRGGDWYERYDRGARYREDTVRLRRLDLLN